MTQPHSLSTRHGALKLPAFLPDGTRGVVRTLDSADLERSGITGLMVNALHLSTHPGTSLVASHGGIHDFMGWPHPVASDSGGFQVYSLIKESSNAGTITNKGFNYRLDRGHKKRTLTPEKCIQKQFMIGADIMFCLDHCTHPDDGEETQLQSVKHTVEWARKCKAEFSRQVEQKNLEGDLPLLYGIIQGGENRELREQCAAELLEIGFDGFGFGGWPVDDAGGLVDAVAYVAELIPQELPRHALGIGKPENLIEAFHLGYHTFDCVLPTRDARKKRLYVFEEEPHAGMRGTDFYRYLYIEDEPFARDTSPIDPGCDCACCQRYSRAYLHHLFQIGEGSAYRLATLHNLRFYTRLISALSQGEADH
jgi:queuine tRNA-ribosyltransferase